LADLQGQYNNFKNTLQQIAQKIGDLEQEAEEHKYVTVISFINRIFPSLLPFGRRIFHKVPRVS